jgi:Bacterial toxin 28
VLSRQAVETARRRLRALAAGRIELMQRLTELMEHPGLRSRTRDFVADARNAIRDHMTPQDLSGALRDRLGMPVRRSGSERTYDHLHEVRDTLRGMEKARRALLGELQRLEPGSEGFRVVSRDLDAMAEMQRRVHEFLETR